MVTSQPPPPFALIRKRRVDGYRTRAIITAVPHRVAILLLPYFSLVWFALLLPPRLLHKAPTLPLLICHSACDHSSTWSFSLSICLSPLFYFTLFPLSLSLALHDLFHPTLRPIHSPLHLSLSVRSFSQYLRLAFVRSGSSLANSHRLDHPRSRNCSLAFCVSLSLLLSPFPFCFTVFSSSVPLPLAPSLFLFLLRLLYVHNIHEPRSRS